MDVRGTVCAMVRTNEEALLLAAALEEDGVRARLIQGNEGYGLQDLAELRFFLKALDLADGQLVVAQDQWEEAMAALKQAFAHSADLPLATRALQGFEAANPRVKYASELRAYLRESQEEDFLYESKAGICISTIHRSKGQEFDEVVLVLDEYSLWREEDRRLLYVGMTRARERLTIHYNRLDWLDARADAEVDDADHPAPGRILFSLGHEDVWLSRFRQDSYAVDRLRAGDPLVVDLDLPLGGCRDAGGREVLRFSERFSGELGKWMGRGYRPVSAVVRHLLWWREERPDLPGEQILIALPRIACSREEEADGEEQDSQD